MRTWVSRLWIKLEIVWARRAGQRWFVELDGHTWRLAVDGMHIIGGKNEANPTQKN